MSDLWLKDTRWEHIVMVGWRVCTTTKTNIGIYCIGLCLRTVWSWIEWIISQLWSTSKEKNSIKCDSHDLVYICAVIGYCKIDRWWRPMRKLRVSRPRRVAQRDIKICLGLEVRPQLWLLGLRVKHKIRIKQHSEVYVLSSRRIERSVVAMVRKSVGLYSN